MPGGTHFYKPIPRPLKLYFIHQNIRILEKEVIKIVVDTFVTHFSYRKLHTVGRKNDLLVGFYKIFPKLILWLRH